MFNQSIDTLDKVFAADDISRELSKLAADLDTHFLHAGTTLADAISMIDRIVGGLDAIVEALGEKNAGGAAADLAHVAGRINDLPATLTARRKRMTDIAGIASTLRAHVLEIHRALRVLGIYGMNIKIAASGEEQFVGFVDGMSARLASGELLLAGVIAKLKDLEAGLAGVQQVDRLLAAECARVVPAVPQRLAADAASLNVHLGDVAALAVRVAAVARSVQRKTGILLGALQVGDSTRQRLEHVVMGLQLIKAHDCSPAAAGYVAKLLAAQLDATAEAFTKEAGALVESLDELVPDAQSLLDLIEEQAGDNGRGFLLQLDGSVTEMDRVMVQLQAAYSQAQTTTSLIMTTVTDLTQRVDRLSAIRVDVQDIATNTRLLCRRVGQAGRAVSVVATEVEVYARDLGTTTQAAAVTIKRLASAEASLSHDEGERGIAEVLGGALAIIRKACQRTEQAVFQGDDDAQRLITRIQVTAAELQQELALTDTMKAASVMLAGSAAAAPDVTEADESTLCALLTAIAKIYTMASEREIHAPFLLLSMDAGGAIEREVNDEDDDGLF